MARDEHEVARPAPFSVKANVNGQSTRQAAIAAVLVVCHAASAVSTRRCAASLSGASGSRTSGEQYPSSDAAAFTGVGFVSTNIARQRSKSAKWRERPLLKSPVRQADVSAETASGAMLETTEITPLAPTPIIGKVSESSPETTTNAAGASRTIWLAWSSDPLASLIPTIPGVSANRTTVSGSRLTPVRPGTL